jgi:hypothetical protein
MQSPFDIIRIENGETLAWVEAAESLTDAKCRVWELILDSPGEYIVYNQETKQLISLFSPKPAPFQPDSFEYDTPLLPPESCPVEAFA